MLKWVALVATMVACGSHDPARDWKPRTGPGFVVEAPFSATVTKRPTAGGTEMQAFEFGGHGELSLQVMTSQIPEGASAQSAIDDLREHLAKAGTILHEETVTVGSAVGKDIRYKMTLPGVGDAVIRSRILVRDRAMFQVNAMHAASSTMSDADGDRFIDSFRLSGEEKKPMFRVVSGEADADGWTTGRSPNGFSIHAPGAITEGSTEEAGKQIFSLGAMKMPERIRLTATCVLTGLQSEADVRKATANAEARRERTVAGHKALEVDSEGNASYLFVFDGARLCALAVQPRDKTMPRQTELAAKFFDSFAFDP